MKTYKTPRINILRPDPNYFIGYFPVKYLPKLRLPRSFLDAHQHALICQTAKNDSRHSEFLVHGARSTSENTSVS